MKPSIVPEPVHWCSCSGCGMSAGCTAAATADMVAGLVEVHAAAASSVMTSNESGRAWLRRGTFKAAQSCDGFGLTVSLKTVSNWAAGNKLATKRAESWPVHAGQPRLDPAAGA